MSRIRRPALAVLVSLGLTTSAAVALPSTALADEPAEASSEAQIGEPLFLGDDEDFAQPQSGEVTSEADVDEVAVDDVAEDTSRAVAIPSCATDILKIVNTERSKAGVAPLQLNSGLNRTAHFWGDWMATTGNFIHLPAMFPDEGWALIRSGGASGILGENIAHGQTSPKQVMSGWMNSPGHRANILNSNFRYLGVGCVTRGAGIYWVQQFSSGVGNPTTNHKRIDVPTGQVSIKTSSNPQVGVLQSVTTSGRLPEDAKVSYQWMLNGAAIQGATTSTYTPPKSALNQRLSVRLTFTANPSFYKAVTKTVDAGVVKPAVLVQRYFGKDRYKTSLEVLRNQWRAGTPLFIVAGASFPDALSAAPAVAKQQGGMLLASKSGLSSEQMDFLKQNRPNKAYIIGGFGSLSATIDKQLSDLGSSPERVRGADRYATSLAVLNKFFDKTSVVFMASGQDYPDALTASAVAGKEGAPVVLVSPRATGLEHSYNVALYAKKVDTLNLVGGSGAISKQFEQSIKTYQSSTYKVYRYSGSDRYATAAALNDRFFGNTGRGWITSGQNFPDALSASWAAGRSGEPLYLVRTSCVPGSISQSLKKHQITSRVFVGGPAVVGQGSATC